ncbi:haloacid dehalogenase type II [Actinophytocola oryzae]|uniref:2-haloacid dehalogenase n=1 Tax=Actinophytocola oryzae TaxID=502181 RepID=A0A4R7VV60_9PSEU|nr:haloacid dehalogenase type II [Actinophytocola oryzae]TDV53893.1 2-haloacid dehalogenase [Actinophytocola oryzae]
MDIRVVACDIFGTTVDWYTGVADQVAQLLPNVDAGDFAERWRDRYIPSMNRVRSGERDWAYLDTLHRESLDDLLRELDVEADDETRDRLVLAWHRLPAWPDSVSGLARLRAKHVTATLSNGGVALLTHLVKAAALPFDCVLSAELAHAYKPDAAVYQTAAALLDVQPEQILMVAAHKWDLVGARKAGLRTAFLSRPLEKGPNKQADQAADVDCDLYADSFLNLAAQLE